MRTKRRTTMRKRSWSCYSCWLSCLHLPPSRSPFGVKVEGVPLVTHVWFLVGHQPETFWGPRHGAWGPPGSLLYLRLEREMRVWKGPEKKRNDFSALGLLSSHPLARFFCLSLEVLLCLSSLGEVKVRTRRKRRSWRRMRMTRTCGVGEHLFGAGALSPFVALVLPPSAESSLVPFLSLFLWRGSGCSSFAVEEESGGTCWGGFASSGFWTCFSWRSARVLCPSPSPCSSPSLCPAASLSPGLTRPEEEKLSWIAAAVPDTASVEFYGPGRRWRFSGAESATSWLEG